MIEYVNGSSTSPLILILKSWAEFGFSSPKGERGVLNKV